jgi:hypothetical protein
MKPTAGGLITAEWMAEIFFFWFQDSDQTEFVI